MSQSDELRATTKRCYVCHLFLDVSMFHKHSRMCIKCRSEYDRARPNRTNPRSVSRNNTDAARARKRRWSEKNRDPYKNAARLVVRRAIVSGVISRPQKCSNCGEEKKRRDGVTAIQAHHHKGYDNPLEVVWLCSLCHTHEHRSYAAIAASKKEGKDG